MGSTFRIRILAAAACAAWAVASCGSNDDVGFGSDDGLGGAAGDDAADAGGVDGTGGAGGGKDASVEAEGGGAGGAGGCTSAAQCDDGIACTVDSCVSGNCAHASGPASAADACPAGKYCEVGTGCVDGPVCGTDDQCLAKWQVDGCKMNVRCDPVTATCTFDTLDKDHDGHAPIACGGDDCDDSRATTYGTATETCNGRDDDCDGVVDDGAECAGAAVCTGGACVCPPSQQCGGSCVDTQVDPANCGACGHVCPSGAPCVGGACACPSGTTDCGTACVNTGTDPANCGACGGVCAAGYVCSAGHCTCTKLPCGGACVDDQSDPNNCGGCGIACPAGVACVNGSCACPKCGGVCVDVQTDPNNCGACSKVCAAGPHATSACNGGVCSFTCDSGYVDCDGNPSNGCEPATTAGAACATPTDLGVVGVGQSKTATSSLTPAGREAWYAITFGGTTSPAFHPHVTLTTNPGGEFVFDVYSGCGGAALSCDEGGTATGMTDWEVALAPGVGEPGAPGYVPPPMPNANGTVFVRVRRTNAVNCDGFVLTIRNFGPCNDPRFSDCDALPGCEALAEDACGGCGKPCSGNHVQRHCSGSTCDGACEPGWGDCNGDKRADGCEAPLTTTTNCGACGNTCQGSAVCSGGTCVVLDAGAD